MYIDSHCHLDFPELAANIDDVMAAMRNNEVGYGLCISVTLPDFPRVLAVAAAHDNLFATVGVHPDYELEVEPTVEDLVRLAQHPKVVGIGETGLDYTGSPATWNGSACAFAPISAPRSRPTSRSSSTPAPQRQTPYASCRKRARTRREG